jgi:predicted phosphodiesterase
VVKLGVLSDVHGNRHALEAVLADGAALGVDRWWALGDLVAIGPDPVAVLELLTDRPDVVATRGNTERYTLTRDRPPPHADEVLAHPELLDLFAAIQGSFAWTRGALASAGWLTWLAELPLEVRTELPDGTRVLGVHGTPGRDDGDGISPQRPEEELRAELAGAEADIVIAGHTHRPTDRWVGAVRALNGGSVSNPTTDERRATYVVIHGDQDSHRVEHRRVEYDHEAFLERVRSCGHPEHEYIASFQRGEQFSFPSRSPGAPAWAD